jgi:tetratricopeptide (TPR) repeat protein
VLGEYERGYRILSGFQASIQAADWDPPLIMWGQVELVNDLALFSDKLGRLAEARSLRKLEKVWRSYIFNPTTSAICFANSSQVSFAMGLLVEAYRLANQAVKEYQDAKTITRRKAALIPFAYRAIISHCQGDLNASEADFAAATQLEGEILYSLRGSKHARHCLDLGDHVRSRALVDHGLGLATQYHWNDEIPLFHALLARLALAEGSEPTVHLDVIRTWTSRSGDMEWIITAHLLTAQHALAMGDLQAALSEAELGLLHAETCGYGLLRIELLIVLAHICQAWPDPHAAIQAARQALDLATAPECGYAWGEADAYQALGEAYHANGEMEVAQSAFFRALGVRQRIRHPGVKETEKWLAHIS